jgi:hypothetical protein
MIPWVFALVVLFGWNAFAGNRGLVRKNPCPDGVSLSQLADDLQAPRGVVQSSNFVGPPTLDRFKAADPASMRLGIEILRDLPTAGARAGAVQGRAPPVTRTS